MSHLLLNIIQEIRYDDRFFIKAFLFMFILNQSFANITMFDSLPKYWQTHQLADVQFSYSHNTKATFPLKHFFIETTTITGNSNHSHPISFAHFRSTASIVVDQQHSTMILSQMSPNHMKYTSKPQRQLQEQSLSNNQSSIEQREQLLNTTELTWDTLLTLILPYSIIFVLSITGNLLVIITLSMNRSMRSVTNIFLLNLAISDLLLGVFCMPFTLVGVLLRRFIFGAFMCHLISYLQTVSVAVSVWTLVAMSVERYYAICQPLRSRERRQTVRHAYRMLAIVWTSAIILMSPTAIVSRLQLIPQTNNFKCREEWPSFRHKELFTVFLDLSLLIIPLVIMILTYTSIAITLKQNIHHNKPCEKRKKSCKQTFNYKKSKESIPKIATPNSSPSSGASTLLTPEAIPMKLSNQAISKDFINVPSCSRNRISRKTSLETIDSTSATTNIEMQCSVSTNSSATITTTNVITTGSNGQMLRISSSLCTIQARQRRVVIMLCVVVIEFFICWTPVFIMDTLALYQPIMVYGTNRNISRWLGIDLISLCHLLCFSSSCTNPVTYCFMNRRFRRHFFALFRCKTNTTVSRMNTALAGFATNENESEIGQHHQIIKNNSTLFAQMDSPSSRSIPVKTTTTTITTRNSFAKNFKQR